MKHRSVGGDVQTLGGDVVHVGNTTLRQHLPHGGAVGQYYPILVHYGFGFDELQQFLARKGRGGVQMNVDFGDLVKIRFVVLCTVQFIRFIHQGVKFVIDVQHSQPTKRKRTGQFAGGRRPHLRDITIELGQRERCLYVDTKSWVAVLVDVTRPIPSSPNTTDKVFDVSSVGGRGGARGVALTCA